MARIYIPPLEPISPRASYPERLKALEDYEDEIIALNPHICLPRGVRKRWWQFGRLAFPARCTPA